MEPVGRRADIKGSLLLKVTINLKEKRIQRGVEEKGEQERTDKGVGGGSGHLLEEGGVKTEDPGSGTIATDKK